MSRPEILAPAGNREMLGAAVFSGADAVYLGLTGFNARRTAGNFTPEELREAVAFCLARGVKVHVTLNTLVYDRELAGLADAVRAVAAAGADAVIADDLATAQLVKSIAPTLHLHGSTQMSVHTPEGAKELAARPPGSLCCKGKPQYIELPREPRLPGELFPSGSAPGGSDGRNFYGHRHTESHRRRPERRQRHL